MLSDSGYPGINPADPSLPQRFFVAGSVIAPRG